MDLREIQEEREMSRQAKEKMRLVTVPLDDILELGSIQEERDGRSIDES